jgi:hypothetical protein
MRFYPQRGRTSMLPQELPDEALAAIHRGAEPLYFRDRPRYYNVVAPAVQPL